MSPRQRPGTYDAVLPGLKPLPPEDASRQAAIAAHKDAVLDRDAGALATAYIGLRREKEDLAAALSHVQLRLEAHEQLLAESQERGAAGWGDYGVKENAIRLPSGDTIRIQNLPYGQVKDKEAFRVWCLANGYERQMQIHHNTMQNLVKERLKAGDAEPDGCEVYAKTTVVYARNGTE